MDEDRKLYSDGQEDVFHLFAGYMNRVTEKAEESDASRTFMVFILDGSPHKDSSDGKLFPYATSSRLVSVATNVYKTRMCKKNSDSDLVEGIKIFHIC